MADYQVGYEAFSFQFAACENVREDMAVVQQQLNMAIANLDQMSNKQLVYWSSIARDTYNEVKGRWDGAALQMDTILKSIHLGLGNAHDNFHGTEQMVTGLFT